MGVPKFYRWISERYPCLSEKIKEYQIPEFDNLYLDMNGIIHACSHPNDEDVHLRIPEQYIFRDIFRYLDFLFKMIKPLKVFFMAVDGVAPRAKMNQQRGRRFRSAKIAEDQEKEAVKNGEILPTEERFDSNCITPGTEFMAKLHEQLKYFIKIKISTDPLWQREGLVVILSGHDVPGEGEHKIMDYIRHLRSQPNYNPETRHCLYGLDADLMMLGLSCHELRFSLLREEVKFNNRPRKSKKKKVGGYPVTGGAPTFDLTNVSIYTNESGVHNTSTVEIDDSAPTTTTNDQSYAAAIAAAKPTPTDSAEKPFDAEAVLAPSNYEGIRNRQTFKPPIPEKTPFYLLHLSLLRDYIDEEFKELRETLSNHETLKYDLEKVIDDWILLSILVGNDFVPHLPKLHIAKGALPLLYNTYMKVLPTLDGYINENGILNLRRFEALLRALSVFDIEEFEKDYDDMQWKLSKTKVPVHKVIENFDFEGAEFEEEALEPELGNELLELIQRSEADVAVASQNCGSTLNEVFGNCDDLFDEEQSPEFKTEFFHYKRDYYNEKLKITDLTKPKLQELNEDYIRAICWILLYYYKGVSSWGWYYPHHYAPYASDLREISQFNIRFEMGNPFKPFEQLLGVLPAQSKKLLPRVYHDLMTDTKSPIVQYYPDQFEQDLNGKRNDWEAVVLIPFIEEKLLLKAMSERDDMLTNEEKMRNARGLMCCYRFTTETCGPVDSPGNIFPTLKESHAAEEMVKEVTYNPQTLPKGLHPKAKQDVIYQGFPTLKSKPHTGELTLGAGVKVFDFVAREESLILQMTPEDLGCVLNAYNVARMIAGKMVWVNWPHLSLALVTAVSDASVKYLFDSNTHRVYKDLNYHGGKQFESVMQDLEDSHKKFKGINFTERSVIIWAKPMEGRKVRCNEQGKICYQMQWGKHEQPYPLQTIIFEMDKVVSLGQNRSLTFKDFYKTGQQVFVLQGPYFGFMGTVIGYDEKSKNVKLEFGKTKRDVAEQELKEIRASDVLRTRRFEASNRAAQRCGVQSFVFNKLTGSIYVSVEKEKKLPLYSKIAKRAEKVKAKDVASSSSSEEEVEEIEIEPEPKKDYKFDIGLNLKFNVRNQEVRGYTRKQDGQWYYSAKTVQLVNEYCSKFTEVIKYLNGRSAHQDVFAAADIFAEDASAKVQEILNWKHDKGINDLEKVPLNSQILDDEDIEIIWKRIINLSHFETEKTATAFVHASKLFKPGVDTGCVTALPDLGHNLLDRVICVDPSSTIPLGQLGTIVGIMNPVRTEAENAFSTTSESNVQNLLILCDPMKEAFEPASSTEQPQNEEAVTLLNMLQIGSKPFQKQQKKTTAAEPSAVPDEPKCTLIKLYPFQVLNLTKNEALANPPSLPAHKQQEFSKLLGGLVGSGKSPNTKPSVPAANEPQNQNVLQTFAQMARKPQQQQQQRQPAVVSVNICNGAVAAPPKQFKPTAIIQRSTANVISSSGASSTATSTTANSAPTLSYKSIAPEVDYDTSKYIGVPPETIQAEINKLAKEMYELQGLQTKAKESGSEDFQKYTPMIARNYNRMGFLKNILTNGQTAMDVRILKRAIEEAEARKQAEVEAIQRQQQQQHGQKWVPNWQVQAQKQLPAAQRSKEDNDSSGLKKMLEDAGARKKATANKTPSQQHQRPQVRPPQTGTAAPLRPQGPQANPRHPNPNNAHPNFVNKGDRGGNMKKLSAPTTQHQAQSSFIQAPGPPPAAKPSQSNVNALTGNETYRGNFKILTAAIMGIQNEQQASASGSTTTTTPKAPEPPRKVTLAANFGV